MLTSSCWVACAATASPTPDVATAANERSLVRGPACVSTGPRAEVAVTSYIKGKPPHETFVTDVRARNPLALPVWLLYDVDASFPTIVTSIKLSGAASPSAQVWSFSGDGSFEAVRIPAGGQIVLRHAEVSTVTPASPPALVFARRIAVGGQPAEEWLGRSGLLPSTGDLDLASLPSSPRVHERHVDDSLNAPALHVEVLCVSPVNLSGLSSKGEDPHAARE